MYSPSAEASRIILQKTPESVALIDEWAEVALNRTEFFYATTSTETCIASTPSACTTIPLISASLNDQAVLGALMRRRGWTGTPQTPALEWAGVRRCSH
jgi:hypothetical protein